LGASDHLGAFDPKHNAIPITMTWPYLCTTLTPCAPHRPNLERLQAPNGEIANLWKDFSELVYTAGFADPEEARAWKAAAHERLALRFLFKVADITLDSVKETRAGVTLDSGAGALAIIRVIGTQIREGDAVLFERLDPSAKQPSSGYAL
jgi:hypothetical protein